MCVVACRTPVVAFKALTAGNSSSASGSYVYYQDPYALDVGLQTLAPNADNFTTMQQCEDACDLDTDCSGFTIRLLLVEAARPTTCMLIKGINDPGQQARTFIKADATWLSYPDVS